MTWQRPGSREGSTRLCATLRGGSRGAEGKQTSGAGGMRHVHIMSAPACMGLVCGHSCCEAGRLLCRRAGGGADPMQAADPLSE